MEQAQLMQTLPFRMDKRAFTGHKTDFVVQAAVLERLFGPGVYILWKGSTAIYVGSGKNVLSRLSDPDHHIVPECLRDCDHVEIRTFKSEAMARDYEADLILRWQPHRNKAGKGPKDG